MVGLQFDHDVSRVVGDMLRARSYDLSLAPELGLERASDAQHLLIATINGRTLVTHNGQHFEALHDAWHRWSDAWGVSSTHGAIIIVPHRPPLVLERLLVEPLSTIRDSSGHLYRWRQETGWKRQPYLP